MTEQQHQQEPTVEPPVAAATHAAGPAQQEQRAHGRFRRLDNQARQRLARGAQVANTTPHLAAPGLLLQRQAETGASGMQPPVAQPALIVADDAAELAPGQMRKSAYLMQLKTAVCHTADDILAHTPFATTGCPYIERWFAYYQQKESRHVDRALRKFAPETAGASTAQETIPMVTRRVAASVRTWADTGRVTGIPAELPPDAPRVDAAGLLGRATTVAAGLWQRARGALAGVGRLLFKQADGASAPQTADPAEVQSRLGNGQALPGGVRQGMETAFGRSFADVRVHNDAEAGSLARDLRARAFTVGRDVAFAPGEYRPGSPVGDALIAHELAHVAQQADAVPAVAPQQTGPAPTGALEADADRAAGTAVGRLWGGVRAAAASAGPRLRSGVSLQRCSSEPGISQQTIDAPSTVAPGFAEEEAGLRERPTFDYETRSRSFRFDGDGDQQRELIGRLRATEETRYDRVTEVEVELEQISSESKEKARFDIPEDVNDGGGDFRPDYVQATDGRQPTRMQLTYWGGRGTMMDIHPPERRAGGVTYGVDVKTQHEDFHFPPERSQLFQVFQAEDPRRAGPIWASDVAIGAYRDRFRLTFARPSAGSDQVIFGMSPLGSEGPIGGERLDLQVAGDLNVSVVRSEPQRLAFDLNGDGEADLNLYDELRAKPDYRSSFLRPQPAQFRQHFIHLHGAGLTGRTLSWEVQEGRMQETVWGGDVTDFPAVSQAQAVGILEQQQRAGGFTAHLTQVERRRMDIRQRAAREGVIRQGTFDAWRALSTTMAELQMAVGEGNTPATQPAIQATHRFYTALADETAGRFSQAFSGSSSTRRYVNPYTGTEREESGGIATPGYETTTTVLLDQIVADLENGRYEAAVGVYSTWTDNLDRWVATRLQERRGSDAEEGKQMEALIVTGHRLDRIAAHNPVRVSAVLHARTEYESRARVTDVPLALYYWREDDEWHLVDLTNPSEPFHPTEPARDTETEPPPALFQRLNDEARWPEDSIIYYALPSGTSGRVVVDEGVTVRKFFTWLGIGLAVVGLTLITGGFGVTSVPVVTAFAASGVAGGVAAGASIVHHAQQGSTTPRQLTLDLAQVAAGIGGAAGAVSGRLVLSARLAASQNQPLAGWAARAASIADAVLVPAQILALGGDVVSFAIISLDTVEQLRAIDDGPGSASDKLRAKLIMLTNLAATGTMVALSVRGGIEGYGPNQRIYLDEVNGQLVARVADLQAVANVIGQRRVRGLARAITPHGVMSIHQDLGSDGLELVERIMRQEQAGTVRGLHDWAEFTFTQMNKRGQDLHNVMAELREAERLVPGLGSGEYVNLGGDLRAAPLPGGGRAPSIDITVEGAGGTVLRNIEMTTVQNPVTRSADFNDGLQHILDKAGTAPSGTIEATIVAEFAPVEQLGPNRRIIQPDGTWRIEDANGTVRRQGDFLVEMADRMNADMARYGPIDQVSIVDQQGNLTGLVRKDTDGVFQVERP